MRITLNDLTVDSSGFSEDDLLSDWRQAEEWFLPRLVGDLVTAGVKLGRGECYS